MKPSKNILFFILLSCSLPAVQAQKVDNIEYKVTGDKIQINCSLQTSSLVDLSLTYSDNEGLSFNPCPTVSGDLKNQESGTKILVWDCSKDKISPDFFLFNIVCAPAAHPSIVASTIEQSEVSDPFLIGEQLMNQGKTEQAEKYFELCNRPEEWNKAAKLYVDRGGKENCAKAFELLQKSAKGNNAIGMCNLGYMYEKGIGTKKDEAAAARCYTSSAEQNYAPAQYNLGLMIEYGSGGFKSDKNEAAKWYEKAAKQGFGPALKRLNKNADDTDNADFRR